MVLAAEDLAASVNARRNYLRTMQAALFLPI
jgi:hypothetical protein